MTTPRNVSDGRPEAAEDAFTAVAVDFLTALRQVVREMVAEEMARAPVDQAASPYLTVEEAAAYLGCKRQRIYDLRSSGVLSRYSDGSRALVARAELDAYVRGELPERGGLPVAPRRRNP